MDNNLFNNPKTYTLSAMIIGYILIGDLTAYEQNALGNWFMTIGQILEANSAFLQVFQSNNQNNNNLFSNLTEEDITDIKKTISYLEKKLSEIKKYL